MNNFILSGCDTDSIAFRKADNSFISQEERQKLLSDLNAIFPEKIRFTDDGYFSYFIVLAAKNYIMKDEKGKVKLKGSSLKSSTLEPILKQFLNDIINSLLNDKQDFVEIYHKYIKISQEITDIKPWASKKTLSATTYASTRENEAKIIRAIQGSDYVEGDRVYCFYGEDDELVLVENFKGSYNKKKMIEKIYKCTDRFSSVLDRSMFINYNLKKNSKLLEELLSRS